MRETRYISNPADTTHWKTLLEIDGGSGELLEVGVRNIRKNRHGIKVNIDDEEVLSEVLGGEDVDIPLNMPFERNMSVEIRDHESDPTARFYVNYIIDIPETPESRIERWVLKIERATGIDIDILLTIAGIVLTLIGIAIGIAL